MWNTIKSLLPFRTELRPRAQSYYSGPELSFVELQNYLNQFKGGSLDLEKDESSGIATICINHYEKRNAISGKMMVDLANIVKTLKSWEAGRGVLLYGHKHTFCSGGDLDFACKISNPEGGFQMSTFMHNVLDQFQRLPLITVALIEGTGALGGGAELAVACDFRLMTEDSMGIGFVHSKMGLIPAWGGATRLVGLLGYKTALELLATARIISAKEAIHLGLVDALVSTDDALVEGKEWLKLRTKYAREVVQATKITATKARDLNYKESLEQERRTFAPLWGGSANREALHNKIKHQ